jgi:thiosulfate/3-mercaptopyruvate sulfurtransferase
MACIRVRLVTLVLAILAVMATTTSAAPCGGHGDHNTMLVSTSWLAEHLHDANLVVLAVGEKSDYDKGHIPGSLFADYMDSHLMKGPTGLTLELPPMNQLAEVFGKLGITNDSHIVLYQAKDWFSPTARVYMTLDAMGLGAHTSVLDGGFAVWGKEGREISKEGPASVKPGVITPCPADDVITDITYVSANMQHAGVAIVDARLPEYYTGKTQPEKQRRGHIPGAGNLPYTWLAAEDGKLKSPEQLAALFRDAGVKQGDEVVAYCHIGQQASAVYFAARYLGYDVRLYDGSWEDWSAHKDLPAETTRGIAPASNNQ